MPERIKAFEAATMAEADQMIRAAYARSVAAGMPLWPAEYIGPDYSGNIAAAWEVVEAMHQRKAWTCEVEVDCFNDGRPAGTSVEFWYDMEHPQAIASADTAPLAICRAALLALTPEAPDAE